MNKRCIQISLLLGFGAFAALARSPEAATAKGSTPPACEWQVVTAQKNNILNNIFEGGVIGALAGAKPYRNFVCAKPDIDWSSYGRVEIASVEVAPSNLRKPLSDRQSEQLRDSLAKSLKRRFDDSNSGITGRALKLRATVTEVRRTNAILNIVALAAIQTPVSFGGASTHFQLIDGVDGTTIGEVTLRGRGRLYDVISSVTPLGYPKAVLKGAPKQVMKDIETLRNTFGPAQNAALPAFVSR